MGTSAIADTTAAIRRFNADRKHRARESTRSFIREVCHECGESFQVSAATVTGQPILRNGICTICRAEAANGDREDLAEMLRRGMRVS